MDLGLAEVFLTIGCDILLLNLEFILSSRGGSTKDESRKEESHREDRYRPHRDCFKMSRRLEAAGEGGRRVKSGTYIISVVLL